MMTKHTENLYTSNEKLDKAPSLVSSATVKWIGDSYARLKEFPKEAKQNLGKALRDVQIGKEPPDSKPVPGVGRHGVFELRDEDQSAWYRVVYLKKIRNIIYVLHSFEKQSNRIEKQDIRTIKQRLSEVDSIEREEARDAKRRQKFNRPHHRG